MSLDNRTLVVCTMTLPTVDDMLSTAEAPSRALWVLEKNVTEAALQ